MAEGQKCVIRTGGRLRNKELDSSSSIIISCGVHCAGERHDSRHCREDKSARHRSEALQDGARGRLNQTKRASGGRARVAVAGLANRPSMASATSPLGTWTPEPERSELLRKLNRDKTDLHRDTC